MSEIEGRNPPDRAPGEQETGELDASTLDQSIQMVRGPRDVWKPSASFGRLLGVLLIILTGIVALVSFWQSLSGDGTRVIWLAVAIAGLAIAVAVGFLLHALSRMRYVLGLDHLAVEWLNQRRIIPFADILDVVYDPRSPVPWPRWEPFWPGLHVSTVPTPEGLWRSWASQPPRRRIRIVTSHGIIAISPARPILFLEELERRIEIAGSDALAPRQVAEAELEIAAPAPGRPFDPAGISRPRSIGIREEGFPAPRRAVASLDQVTTKVRAVWAHVYDRLLHEQLLADQVTSSLVAVGVLIPVLMAAWLYSQYEGLSPSIPLHWDAQGQVDQVGTPRDLWRFPLMALLILLANTALAALVAEIDRFLARLLAAGTLVAQIVAFIALIRIMG